MKKLLITLLAVSMLFILAGCKNNPATPDLNNNGSDDPVGEEPAEMVYVGRISYADEVNIRIEPSTEGRKIGIAKRGSLFEVINYQLGNEWHQVRYNGEPGYISSEFLVVEHWEKDTEITIAIVKADTGAVNVRANAAENGAVLLSALSGDQFIVLEADNGSGWCKVSLPESAAYIKAEYLDITDTTLNKVLN